MKNISNKKGFTLVEIMIAILLTSLVITTAFAIWSKIQRGIVLSTTKQRLQNELRKTANYMQNDFKSIKASGTFSLTPSTNNNFSMSFEKFKEKEDGSNILAQNSTEKIQYDLKENMLTRTSGDGKTILSLNCESISIERAVDEVQLKKSEKVSVNLESLNEDFKDGRKAKLEISIVGKMRVPGSNDDIYHTEKTSVVMKDEYYKNTNKTYTSTFDLTQKNSEDIIQAGQSNIFGDESLDYEYLITLTDSALSDLKSKQEEGKTQANERLDQINGNIKETEVKQGVLSWLGDALGITHSEEGQVKQWRDNLASAKEVKEVENVKKDVENWLGDKKLDYMKLSTENTSIGKTYNQMTEEEKEVYKIAYDLKCQDRTLEKAQKNGSTGGGENGEGEEVKKAIDIYKNGSDDKLEDEKGNRIELKDSEKKVSNKVTINGQVVDKKEAVIKAYEDIDLSWMDDHEDEQNTYAAAGSLVSQADMKIEILKMINVYNENIEKIDKAWNDKNRPRS